MTISLLVSFALAQPVSAQVAPTATVSKMSRVPAVHARGKVADTSSYSALSLVMNLGVFAFAGGDERSTFGPTPGLEFATGLRLDRHIQLDAALNIAFGSAGVSRTIQTTLGSRNTMDHELFVMLGGRYIWSIDEDDILASLGGGWVYGAYSEDAGDISKEIIYCRTCAAETTGQGGYVVAELDLFPTASKDVGLSIAARGMSVTMNNYFLRRSRGASAAKPNDNWVSLTAGLVLRL